VIIEPPRHEFMCVIICVVIGSLAYESLTKLTEVSFGEKCNQLLHSDTLQQINSYCLSGFRVRWLIVSLPKTSEAGGQEQRRVKSPRSGCVLEHLFLDSSWKVICNILCPKSSKITNNIHPIL